MLDITEYLKIMIGLLAIINPIAAVPIFISMTSSETPLGRENVTKQTGLAVLIILLVALVFGDSILSLFAITIDSFRVGGGILILLMAISMLHAKTSPVQQTPEEAHEGEVKDSAAIVPLAMPLLAGPGAISTVILAAHKSPAFSHYFALGLTIIVVSSIVWGVLKLSPYLVARLSATGINIFSRIMGLILTAIAIEFIANGLKGLFPALN